MAIRNLTPYNDPRFDKTSREITQYNPRLFNLLDDMRDTLSKARGYGCAAVHMGVLRRVVLILEETGTLELINPTITRVSTQTQRVLEGSIAPGAPQGYVMRPLTVTVAAYNRQGQAITITGEGFLAATLCHEIDHINGIRYSDKFLRLP